MATYKPSDFNKKVAFGEVQSIKNPHTGAYSKEFVPKVTLWYRPKTRTLNQQYQLTGTALEKSQVIIIRHNPAVEDYPMAKIGDVKYDIADYSADDVNNAITYDFVTLKRRA